MHLHITHLVSFITISIKFSQMRKQNLFSSIFKVLLREGCRVRSNYTYRLFPTFFSPLAISLLFFFFSSLNVRVTLSRDWWNYGRLRATGKTRKDARNSIVAKIQCPFMRIPFRPRETRRSAQASRLNQIASKT